MKKTWTPELSQPSINTITIGAATVPFDERNKAWVKVGGKKIDSQNKATEYARKLNQLIRAQQ